MRWLIVSLAAALAPCAAWPQQEQQPSDPHPQQQAGERHDKTYGQYGEEPGTEARSDTKQSSDPRRAKSKASQDERADSTAADAKARTVIGRIVKATPSSLSVRGEEKRVHRLRITEQTEVLRGGKRVQVSDLREGEDVRASFDTRGDQLVAKRIAVGEDSSRKPASDVDKTHENERRMRGDPEAEQDPQSSSASGR